MVQALVVEVVLTSVFVLTILGVTSKVENGSVGGALAALVCKFLAAGKKA